MMLTNGHFHVIISIEIHWIYTKDALFERRLSFIPKTKTFVVGKITKAIYSGNLSLIYYSKYMKEERMDDIYDDASMNQVFEVNLEQLFKKKLEQ